ncbi:MAG: flagellar filament capping protein FliD [Peptococcaceae bacterium]|nr:flagellar filament capping protein FliD [Peptococcaceae bacterium]
MSTISPTRYFGLSGSGLDIDTIVSNLMKAQRTKQDKIKQNKTIADWQRSDYREINNSLRSLRDNVFKMKLQGSYLTKKAVSSNEGIVKVSSTSTAVVGAQDIKVTALASNARLNSSEVVTFDASKTNLHDQLGLTSTDPIVFKVNGSQEISINPSIDTIDTLVSKINSAKKTVTVDGSSTEVSAGVTASFDKTLKRIFISSNSTGAAATIDFDNVSNSSELFNDLKLDGNPDPGVIDPFAAVNGTDAVFELNGTLLNQASNQFTIAGVNYTLTGTSTSETVHVNITSDTDAIYNSIKTFVDLYNTTIDKVNKKTSEEKYKDYPPLTDEQRKALTDDQEKQWEEKAKSGLLRNDSLLNGIVGNMRSALSSFVSKADSGYNSLASIGITTGDYSEKGKLYIDEDKLKEAINANPDAVMDLFTKSSDVNSEKGLAVRLYDNLTSGINQLIDKAGSENSYSAVDNSFLGKKIAEYNKQISDWDTRLQDIEDRYYKQFTAMETALNKMNQQSQYLTQMFSSSK